ncbi:ribonuclease D [Plectonema cf. radiosum LEGE 06105]|uniref:Ribonuclease D n=1 Tax=Plectonema cf. radiosum LEGE 06105 TaxID=945769 RepID=A0A8J7F3H5_9CYAN|nr:ribonuclease D [Plectonema radiosum]MBE9213318.1 ribonuclease D [Plectonema cf. radiosum LEGE 06105]
MPYLKSASEIRSLVAKYTKVKTLWLDTEVADYDTRNPKLSLIQVLHDCTDLTGESVYILDVLEQPFIVEEFIEKIMMNSSIEKVFHNAKYDLRFLGKKQAKNVTCTLEMAKQIPYYILPLPNYQLKTLAIEICHFQDIDKQQQSSDWGIRPLSEEQIEYAYFDCIILAQVHLRLLELTQKLNFDAVSEDLSLLGAKYIELEHQWQLVKSEFEHLQERVKQAMVAQQLSETPNFKLNSSERTTIKVPFSELVRLVETQNVNLDFDITLTKDIQKNLGDNIEQLAVDISKTTSLRLISKQAENEE